MSRKKHKLILPIRLIIWIAILGIAAYAGVVCYVCIEEGSVNRTVPEADSYDAIIVLGAQVLPDGNPSVQLTWRLDAALDAYRQKQVPVVVCGARGKDEPMTEAEAMRNYLMAGGIPDSMIMTDPDSFNTRQNMINASKLLENRQDVRRVLIVTSDYHLPRSMALAGDCGFEATGLGSPCKPEYWIKNHAREALAWCKYWAVKYLHLPLE